MQVDEWIFEGFTCCVHMFDILISNVNHTRSRILILFTKIIALVLDMVAIYFAFQAPPLHGFLLLFAILTERVGAIVVIICLLIKNKNIRPPDEYMSSKLFQYDNADTKEKDPTYRVVHIDNPDVYSYWKQTLCYIDCFWLLWRNHLVFIWYWCVHHGDVRF
eukprot:49181_1